MRADELADLAVLEHYRRLAEESPAMAPMYLLVVRLCGKEYAALLPAGTSHDALMIGSEDADGISVDYLPDVRVFQVCYRPRKTGKPEKWRGDLEMAERLVDSLVLRLLIRKRYPEAT